MKNLPMPARISGMSPGDGGVSSTLAYFRKVANFGRASASNSNVEELDNFMYEVIVT